MGDAFAMTHGYAVCTSPANSATAFSDALLSRPYAMGVGSCLQVHHAFNGSTKNFNSGINK